MVLAGGCGPGLYTKLPPAYDLVKNQDKKVLILVESPRSAAADVDVPEKLIHAVQNNLENRAKIKLENLIVFKGDTNQAMLSPEQAAKQAGAGLALFIRIEDYELVPQNVRDYYYGRMVTRATLLSADNGLPLWPSDDKLGKVHDIVIEVGKGGRDAVLKQMAESMAHCILRNLYPIEKLYYKNSDERVSVQEAFELDTF